MGGMIRGGENKDDREETPIAYSYRGTRLVDFHKRFSDRLHDGYRISRVRHLSGSRHRPS